jgi:hypothetical protein
LQAYHTESAKPWEGPRGDSDLGGTTTELDNTYPIKTNITVDFRKHGQLHFLILGDKVTHTAVFFNMML